MNVPLACELCGKEAPIIRRLDLYGEGLVRDRLYCCEECLPGFRKAAEANGIRLDEGVPCR